ncbi:unnamed protein product [Coccothraustes coccothraustes]
MLLRRSQVLLHLSSSLLLGVLQADHRYCAETESASGRQSRFVALVGSRTGLCDGALTFPFEGVTWRAFGKGRGVAAEPVMKAVASERGRSVGSEEPGPSWQEGGPQVLRRDRVSKWPPEPADHRYCAETESASGRQSRFFALVGSRTGLCDGALTFPFEGVTWRAFGKGRGVAADHRYCAETESASGRQSRFVALVGSRTGLCDGALTFPFEGVTWRAFGKGRGVAADHRYCAETESASGRQSRFVALVGSRTGLCDGALTFPFEGVTWRAFGKGRGVAAEPVMKAVASERGRSVRPEEPGPSWQEGGPQVLRRDRVSKWPPEPADHRYCAETESASGRQSRFFALVGSRTGLCDGALTFPFEGVTWRAFGKGRGVAADHRYCAETESASGRQSRFVALVGSRTGLCDGALTFPFEGVTWRAFGKGRGVAADHRYCAETESASGRQSRFVALVGSRTGLCDGALTFPFEGVTWRAFGKGRGVAADHRYCAETESASGRQSRFVALVGSRTGLCDGALTFPFEGVTWRAFGKGRGVAADHRYCAETESASGRQSRFVALVGSRTGLCDGALTFPFEGVTWRAFGKGRGVAADHRYCAETESASGRQSRFFALVGSRTGLCDGALTFPFEGVTWRAFGKGRGVAADHRYCAETESASGRQSRFVALVGSRTGLCDGALTFPFEGVTWRAFGKGRGVAADHRYCAETESASGRQSRFVALVGSRTGLCDGALTFPFEGVTWRAFGKGRGVAAEPVMKAVASERGRSVRPEEPGPSWQEGGPQVLRRDRVSKWPPEPADHRYCAETESASGRQSRFVALVGSRTGLCDGALTFPFEGVTWRAFGKGRGVAADHRYCAETESASGRQSRFVALVGSRTGLCDGALTFPFEGVTWRAFGKGRGVAADHRYCAETESASGRQSRFVALVGSRTGLCDGALTFPFEGVTWRAFGKGRGVAAEPVMKAVASERGRSVRPEEPGPSWQEGGPQVLRRDRVSKWPPEPADHRYCAETESASGRQSRFVALVGSRTGLCDGALTFPFEGVTWRAFGKGRGVAADHRYCAETESASGRQSRFFALVGSRTGLCDGALTFPFEGVTWRAFGKGRGVAADHRYCAETESASGRQSRFVALVGSRTGLCDGALTFPFEGVTWRAFGKGRGVAAEPVMKAVASERGRSVRPEEPGPSWQEGMPQDASQRQGGSSAKSGWFERAKCLPPSDSEKQGG